MIPAQNSRNRETENPRTENPRTKEKEKGNFRGFTISRLLLYDGFDGRS
jgi:hypothetical protein